MLFSYLFNTAYELSKLEGKAGSPEKPLSDLGKLSYRSYWTYVILSLLKTHGANLTIKEISERTAISTEDILSTLQTLGFIKYWKGQHIIAVSKKAIDAHLKGNNSGKSFCRPECIRWKPKQYPTPSKKRKH